MANVTEPYPKADTLANCGGAVSMGQIGNDVSFFTNNIYFFSIFLFHLFEIPAENAGSRDECACRCWLGFFVSLFLFFRLVTERGRGSTGFSVLSMFLVITTVLCTCIVLTDTNLHLCHSWFVHACDRRIPKVIEILHTIHLAQIQCNEREKMVDKNDRK